MRWCCSCRSGDFVLVATCDSEQSSNRMHKANAARERSPQRKTVAMHGMLIKLDLSDHQEPACPNNLLSKRVPSKAERQSTRKPDAFASKKTPTGFLPPKRENKTRITKVSQVKPCSTSCTHSTVYRTCYYDYVAGYEQIRCTAECGGTLYEAFLSGYDDVENTESVKDAGWFQRTRTCDCRNPSSAMKPPKVAMQIVSGGEDTSSRFCCSRCGNALC